jgi:outer membrane protein OmpA-like peptidoglycan-associated protein
MTRVAPSTCRRWALVAALAASGALACGPDRFLVSYPPLAVQAAAPEAKARPVAAKPRAPQKIEISEKIMFKLGSFDIMEQSFDVLDRVAQVIKANPGIKRVEIQGHTDYFGSTRRNTYVSAERAKAVRNYLIDQGVESSRLEARGYGPTQPIGDNETAEGRERNRRVEFVIVEGALAQNNPQ